MVLPDRVSALSATIHLQGVAAGVGLAIDTVEIDAVAPSYSLRDRQLAFASARAAIRASEGRVGLLALPERISGKSATIRLQTVEAGPGLMIDSADIEVEEPSYDVRDQRVTFASGSATIRISEQNLLGLISEETRDLGISKLQVQITDREVEISGRYPLLVVGVPFTVRGLLEVASETQINFAVLSAWPAQGIIESRLSSLNPVVDVSAIALPVSVRLQKVTLTPGWLVVSAVFLSRHSSTL